MFNDTMLRTHNSDVSTTSTLTSTPPGSPSSSSSGLPDSHPVSPIDPDIECGYIIDLLHLTEENLTTEDITKDKKHQLKSKGWNIREDWVCEVFGYMVDKHQLQHLDKWGICLEMEGRRFKVVWKHQQVSHLQSGCIRNMKKDNRRPGGLLIALAYFYD
ncbi:hypothetical protein ONZ51_g8236 [Trametes cubensis]|uniref:Uncharacterized protein n=1 Tax=Trametes cubensis TaxID=1111947 RepID=A0AAD7X6Q9_9APHY|nr:hypothetical protein ONZ51_g8236 [Trametes cubensis]